MKLPKAHIFREGGRWSCWGGIFCRQGDTPREAYRAWEFVWLQNYALWMTP